MNTPRLHFALWARVEARGPKSCYKPLMVGWDCRGRKELVVGEYGSTLGEPGNISHREGVLFTPRASILPYGLGSNTVRDGVVI